MHFLVLNHEGMPVTGIVIQQEFFVYGGAAGFLKAIGFDGECTTGDDGRCSISTGGAPFAYAGTPGFESVFETVVTLYRNGEEIGDAQVAWRARGNLLSYQFQLQADGTLGEHSHAPYEEDDSPTPTPAPDMHATATQIAINNAALAPSATAAAVTATAWAAPSQTESTASQGDGETSLTNWPLTIASILGLVGLVTVLYGLWKAAKDTLSNRKER